MKHIPKKSLGQHFLRSERALTDMVVAGEVTAKDMVLEIGPGEGVLTERLLGTGAKVVAVEKDRMLIPILSEKFAVAIKKKKLTLIEADVLEFNPSSYKLTANSYKLIANIPYYITGAIMRRFLEDVARPSVIVFLVQKEVAERAVARDGKQSILSVAVHAFGTPKIAGIVKKGSFVPPPKVDSAILAIAIDRVIDLPKNFFAIVHAGFAHKRKLLARNLETLYEKTAITRAFDMLGIAGDARAETVTPPTWIALATLLTKRR